MAYNWDKLSKAQREYPNPKFAFQAAEKALKKHPNSPYLSTWKADLALQQMLDPGPIAAHMQDLHKQPIEDLRLLSYMYEICLEASRRAAKTVEYVSVGSTVLGRWQAVAKTLQRKDDRLALWNALFKTALYEDIWDDVRFAIVNYNKEGPSDKKQSHYALIFANSFSAEARMTIFGQDDRMAQLQYGIALKMMKQAYTASPDDPIAVKDIRDLRFMGRIYAWQRQVTELQNLWDDPPRHLRSLIHHRHREDMRKMTMYMLRHNRMWPELEEHCRRTIRETLSRLEVASSSKSELRELCAWNWEVWSSLTSALNITRSPLEARKIFSEELEACFGTAPKARDRPIQLTYMSLRHSIGQSVLSECVDYFGHHGRLGSCFVDLRPFVENFETEDTGVFLALIQEHSKQQGKDSVTDQNALEHWQQVQATVLKFLYMLTISQRFVEDMQPLISFFVTIIRFSALCPENPDSSCLAVYTLLNLHHRFVCIDEGINPFGVSSNSRLLLQATMYARHLVKKDKDKENRTFALLAARLHLNLGLGTVAFKLYTHVKCKEMLLDTLSPYILSRISQTHPFDVKSYGGFSADEELKRVITTIERMEAKTAEYMVTDLSSFPWDQAWDIKTLKQGLNSSLTKHLCSTERRRIARLRGESTEHIPRLDWKNYKYMTDNIDRDVFPNFETRANSERTLNMVMPNSMPRIGWMYETHYTREHASQRLYNEGLSIHAHLDPFDKRFGGGRGKLGHCCFTRTEQRTTNWWDALTCFVDEIYAPKSYHHVDSDDFELFIDSIDILRLSLEKLRMPGSTMLKPEDEPTMFHENMLMSCYQQLEVLRGSYKLVEHLRNTVIKSKGKNTHPHKNTLPEKYDTQLLESTQICFQAVRDVAQSYIDLILSRGARAIKAQVRWGPTGEMLKHILSDDDVEYYAQEYVESALEAWRGVLKVKLK